MSEQELIQWLWRYGFFWNPEFPDCHNVLQIDLPKLTLKDVAVKYALVSAQNNDLNFEAYAWKHHNRGAITDGIAGPATYDYVSSIDRCAMPDFAPPLDAKFDLGDEGLNKSVQSMQDFGNGSGGWPANGCDPDALVKGVHSIRVRINPAGATSVQKAYLAQCCAAVSESYRDMGILVRYIFDANSAAEIIKLFANLLGSVIGWNEFVSPNSCRQIEGRLDIGFSPSNWKQFAGLEGHETGHGVGLYHTRGGRMNSSMLQDDNPATWRGDTSEAALKKLYGGIPVIIGPTPDPQPDPIPGSRRVYMLGEVRAFDYETNQPIGDYIFVPKPRVN